MANLTRPRASTSSNDRRKGLRRVLLPSLVLAFAGNACTSDDAVVINGRGDVAAASELQGLGTVRLPLVTPDLQKFRLRNATFEIARSGAPVLSLDSEVDPDAQALTADLDPGQYRITLPDGWSLERLEAGGGASPVRAALISPNPADFTIRNERVTTVAFTFTTPTGVVTFGEGSVSVRLGVADPASLASCDVANQSGCPGGQHCLLADAAGGTFCATPGSLEVGAACDSDQCVFGAQCLGLDPAAPGESACTALCNPLSPRFGCDCRGLSFADDAGVCGPPPPGSCDLLTQSGCAEGQACQFPVGSFGVCGAPGSLPEGSSCFGEVCAAGLDCLGDDPVFGFSGTCFRFCDLSAPACEFCFDVGTGGVGRCFL